RLAEGALAVHHRRARLVAKLLDERSGDLGHWFDPSSAAAARAGAGSGSGAGAGSGTGSGSAATAVSALGDASCAGERPGSPETPYPGPLSRTGGCAAGSTARSPALCTSYSGASAISSARGSSGGGEGALRPRPLRGAAISPGDTRCLPASIPSAIAFTISEHERIASSFPGIT